MKRRKRVKAGAGGAALLVIVVGVVFVVREARSAPEKRPELTALAPAPLAVTLMMLGGGGRIAMGGHVPVALQATGPGVDSVTLWEDDRAVSTFAAPASDGTGAIAHTVEWTAVTPGSHVIHASAHGRDGTAHSTPIGVTVRPAPGTPPALTVAAPADATPRAVAAAYGVDPALVKRDATPRATGGLTVGGATFSVDAVGVLEASLPAGAAASAGGDAAAASSTPPTTASRSDTTGPADGSRSTGGTADGSGTPSESPSSAASGGSGIERAGSPPVAPDVPTLHAKVSSCTVEISATDSDDTLTVYTAGVGSVGFTELGTVKPGSDLTTPPMTPGTHVFVAGPVGAPTTTEPVSVVVPDKCVSAIWKGDASITDGILTIPAPDDGLLAVYLSVDDEPARRIPDGADGVRVLTAATRHIDVKPYLPMLGGSKLHLDVWSTDPKTNHATRIAAGDAVLPDGMTPADLIGESTGATLGITPQVAKVVDKTITGTWTTRSARADRVIWQVTTQPMDRTNTSLAPIGLVAWGTSTAKGFDTDGVSPRGTFTIPIDSLVRPGSTPIEAKPMSYPQLANTSPAANLPVATKPVITDPHAIDPALVDAADVSDPQVTGGLVPDQPVLSGTTFFIRVIPLAGTTPLGGASDSVRFDGPTPTDPPQVALRKLKTTFDAGRVANPALAGCVRVTSVPWGASDSDTGSTGGLFPVPHGTTQENFDRDIYSSFFPVAQTYCPGDWKSGSGCQILPDWACKAWNKVAGAVDWFVEVVAKVWDVIAAAYNTIVDTVVDIVAKLNPFCVAATLSAEASGTIGFDDKVTDTAKGAADLCDKIAHKVTKAAISGIMVTFGLPPELPTSQQLEAMATGDLTELAVEYLKQLGFPCDALVLDADDAGLVSSGLDEAGVEVPAGVEDGVDVCRDLAGMALGKVRDEVQGMIQQQIANSTGLPLPTTPIGGFTFEMEPRGAYTPPSISFEAQPKDADTPMNGTCRVTVRTDLDDKTAKKSPEPVFGTTHVDLHGLFGKVWIGNTAMSFNQLAGFKPPDASLPEKTLLMATIDSDCVGDGKSLYKWDQVHAAVTGRWHAGDPD